jgi:hypothetical protein
MKMPPESLDALVQPEFSFLSELGYEYRNATIESTEALGPYLECEYFNKCLQRSILIVLIWSVSPATRDVLVVHLGSGSRTFSLFEYLEHIKASENQVKALELHIQVGSPGERVRNVLRSSAELLQKELLRVIQGLEWKDVPFDWCGYK